MNDSETKRAALIVAVTGAFVTPFMGSSVNVALPSIGKEFRMDAVLLSWVATSFLLAAAAFLVPLGKIADIHGRKKIYTLGMALFAVASLLCASSASPGILIFFRVLQGLGAAMIFGTGMAILSSVFPVEERGKVLGITVAAVYVGLSVGPFIGGVVTEHFTWRGVFLIHVPIGLATIGLIFWKLKGEWAEAKGEKFDLIGSVIYGAALTVLMYGLSIIPSINGGVLICAGIAGAAVFVKWENRQQSPVFNVSLFKANRVFAFSSLAALLHYSATFAVTFLLSIYLQQARGISPRSAGLILVTQPAVMAIFSPLAGWMSDRIEPRIVASVGMGFTGAGLVALTLLTEDSSLGFMIACLVVLGFGFALFSSPNMNAIMSSVEKRFYGIASGSVGTMRLLGQVISMGVATLIFALFMGRVQISPEYRPILVKALSWAFSVFAVFCVCGIFASLARGRLRPTSNNDLHDGGAVEKGDRYTK
jgi:EmrB/QacA subfamily drug resistance transporter